MFNSHRFRALVCLKLKGITFPTTSPTHEYYPLFQPYTSPFSLYFCTNASFPASYLINNLGFSPESAFKASKELRFKTSKKPDSVLNLFKTWGFSDSQLHHMIEKAPWLLSCNPHKRVLPKFRFLLSKGASTSDIVSTVCKSPRLLAPSLQNCIIPTYELIHRFLQSDKKTITCLVRLTLSSRATRIRPTVKLLIDYGVSDSNIARFLRTGPEALCSTNLIKMLEEVQELGFSPAKSAFSVALLARHTVSKSRWDQKVDVFKKWGWSDETILEAFRRQPNCMLVSCDKINALMSFWVNQLGWDALALVKGTNLFGFSLEKRIIPRAFVVRYLLTKGLVKKNASLFSPFIVSEKMFLQNFVICFKEDETSHSHLLKLYQEKINLQDNREDSSIRQLSKG